MYHSTGQDNCRLTGQDNCRLTPHVGNDFVNNIISHIESLKENPDIGRKVPEFNESNIRELIHVPFRIVYLREVKLIHVVRVWRSERLLNLDGTPAKTKI